MADISINTVISEQLSGQAQHNALELINFLQANDIQLDPNGDTGEGWAVGGVVGDSLGFLYITGADRFPGPWTLWLNTCEFGDIAMDDALKETVWAHASPCGKCNKNWENCGGGERSIFGRNFDRLCHSPVMFFNPDAQTVDDIKQLLTVLNNKS